MAIKVNGHGKGKTHICKVYFVVRVNCVLALGQSTQKLLTCARLIDAQLAKFGNHSIIALTAPRVSMKPEWMIGMSRTTRPGRVNETVVKILLYFLDESVAIQFNVLTIFITYGRALVDNSCMPGPECGLHIAEQ